MFFTVGVVRLVSGFLVSDFVGVQNVRDAQIEYVRICEQVVDVPLWKLWLDATKCPTSSMRDDRNP